MSSLKYFTVLFLVSLHSLYATEFTISSYNCGGLSLHYDYLRAVNMEKLMQERHIAEPEYMSQNEKIQKIALKILFSNDETEKKLAKQEWEQKEYGSLLKFLTNPSTNPNSINKKWYDKSESMITSYKVKPVVIYDEDVTLILDEHLHDLTQDSGTNRQQQLKEARELMASRIFANHVNHDIICLQEADYLQPSTFPEHYEVLLADTSHSKNGIAWNKNRFELINSLGNILGRAFAVHLRDKTSDKTLLIASGHISGCNPFNLEINPKTGLPDSAKGDHELSSIIELFNQEKADLMLIGMDSNVTAMHPRLKLLKVANYQIDCENFIEPTCTNPNQLLNTRIDWIALKSNLANATITNLPVLSVGLNNMRTNISDHKPIAAKIKY